MGCKESHGRTVHNKAAYLAGKRPAWGKGTWVGFISCPGWDAWDDHALNGGITRIMGGPCATWGHAGQKYAKKRCTGRGGEGCKGGRELHGVHAGMAISPGLHGLLRRHRRSIR